MIFKDFDVPQDVHAALALARRLWDEINRDSRHAMWLAEEAAEGIEAKVKELEADIVAHATFGRKEHEARCREQHRRFVRDIRFLGCLHTILLHRVIELDARAFAEATRRQDQGQQRSAPPPPEKLAANAQDTTG